MPPYPEISDFLEVHYNPRVSWRQQWYLIKEMAWMIEDSLAYSSNRVYLGKAIIEGIHKAYLRHGLVAPSSRMSSLKESAIKDIESFRTKPEYWANIN